MTLSVFVGVDNLRRELGTFCYIITGLFGYTCPYVRELKRIVEWVASNQYSFERDISNSHQATALLDDVSRLLSEYLNTYRYLHCCPVPRLSSFLLPPLSRSSETLSSPV